MNRQLYMGGGIMNARPRQQYGLGSFVKKAVKKVTGAVKDVASSDLGKAALAGAAAYGLGGGTFFGRTLPGIGSTSGFGFKNIMPNLFGTGAVADYGTGTKGILGSLGLTPGFGVKGITKRGIGTAIAGSGLIAGLLTKAQMEEIDEADPDERGDIVAEKLRQSLTRLGVSGQELEDRVAEGVSEYTGYTSKAEGGRIGFDMGGTYEDFEKFMMRRSESLSERHKEELRKQFEMFMRSKDPTVEAAEGGRIGFDNGSPGFEQAEQAQSLADLLNEENSGNEFFRMADAIKRFPSRETLDYKDMDPGFTIPEPDQSPDATPIPEGMMINPLQTMEFRDENQNGIEDRREGIYRDSDFIPKKDPEEFEIDKFRKYFEDTKKFREVPRKNEAKGTGDPQESINSLKPLADEQASGGSTLTLMDGTEVFIPTGAYRNGTLANIIYSSTKGDLLREDILGKMLFSKGGRVDYADAGPVLPPDPTQPVNPFAPKPTGPVLPDRMASNMENDKILEALFEKFLDMGLSPERAAEEAKKEFERMSMMQTEGRGLAAMGGRMNYALGDTASQNAMQAAGIEGLPIRQNPKGVKELDLRDNGGFIPPVGIKEKEDDIPAMLSNNEFVFTADAVRGMGDGDVELGAQRMYDQMKMLEKGGRV